jgi:CBS-domain-containing membrane protein
VKTKPEQYAEPTTALRRPGHLENWVSATGGLVGILTIIVISRHFVGTDGATWLVASMGATAVLLFAVPHGPLSQPWPVLGGNVISAVIGVTCAQWIPDTLFAAAFAVAISIGVMQYLRCVHPPGGATALAAVVGGEQIQVLGFNYVLTPVLLNVIAIIIVAVIFNYAFVWRRYPAVLATGVKTKNTNR